MAKSQISMTVNGDAVEALVEPRTLLIHFLREQLNLTGQHIAVFGLDQGISTPGRGGLHGEIEDNTRGTIELEDQPALEICGR